MLLPIHIRVARCSFAACLLRLIVLLVLLAGVIGPSAVAVKADPQASVILVKDIRIGKTGSFPGNLTNVNETLFFSANDGIHGEQLWKSDGTDIGTILVKVINPSAGSNPMSFTAVNGVLFFTATDGVHGQELWKSDGTASGTLMVKDIYPGSSNAFDTTQNELVKVNNELFFAADDGSHGQQLWKSDGSAAGTMMVKQINPSGGAYISHLTEMNGMLFFKASEDTHGDELWKSNGTTGGTVMVKDIYPGTWGSSPDYLTNVNGVLFFVADDSVHGPQLWKSNGTTAGTVMVKDINPGGAALPSLLTAVNGRLFFIANDDTHGMELWKSDGTGASTILVKDINPGSASSLDSVLSILFNANGTLFFTPDDGVHGIELWKSDGTQAGTLLVKDIYPGSAYSQPDRMASINQTLFFEAEDSQDNRELWQSDGTGAGTFMVADINPLGSSDPYGMTFVNNTLFFAANDGVYGKELWKLVVAPPLGRAVYLPLVIRH